jgi:outer membrane scaffolding protein for murein synthesis (MipA/OmpV family)
MSRRSKACALGAAIAAASLAAGPGSAQTPSKGEASVGLALGVAPDFPGSRDLTFAPFPSLQFGIGSIEIRSNGLGIEANVAAATGLDTWGAGTVGFGPILRYDLGRNDATDVSDAVVALLAPVRAAPEVGGFVEAAYPISRSGTGAPVLLTARVSVVQGLGDGHGGILADASLGLVRPSGRWTLGGALTVTASDGDYMQSYFGVSAADAVASGLPTYRAKGGIRDIGGTLFASYAVDARWSVDLVAGYSALVGDAADSPIVRQRGQTGQTFVAIGVTRRF